MHRYDGDTGWAIRFSVPGKSKKLTPLNSSSPPPHMLHGADRGSFTFYGSYKETNDYDYLRSSQRCC